MKKKLFEKKKSKEKKPKCISKKVKIRKINKKLIKLPVGKWLKKLLDSITRRFNIITTKRNNIEIAPT